MKYKQALNGDIMKLQDRDYTKYTNEEEKDAYAAEEKYANQKGLKNNRQYPRFSHPNAEVRKFIWHKRSLFPNNYLHFTEYRNVDFRSEANAYSKIIYSASNEHDVQEYIKEDMKWFIPGSIFLDYNFGHHDAYLFPEQSLGNEYVADYMLLGKNSDGYSIVLVEFEKPNTPYLIASSNSESESVRKGITQIRDWKRWIDQNRDYFMKNIGLNKFGIDIPIYRIFYYLVVSRRDYMTDIAKEVRSQSMYEMNNLKIVTFDRLADNVVKLQNCHSW